MGRQIHDCYLEGMPKAGIVLTCIHNNYKATKIIKPTDRRKEMFAILQFINDHSVMALGKNMISDYSM